MTGATGYIGGRLVPRLLEAGHSVRCLARNSARLNGRFPGADVIEGDLLDERSLREACDGVEAAYYLVHSMSDAHEFAERDQDAAARFGKAARECGVRRIIYLGGLGADGGDLSPHLRSRHEVGDTLRKSGAQIIEFRAAMIIGSGSISFEMMRYLSERLPIMIAPRWVTTRSQPIAIRDVLLYLLAALEVSGDQSKIYEIGGADVITYREMMLRYAHLRGLRRKIVVVPFFTPRLSSYWVHIVTPVSARLAQPLILGLHNEVVVRNHAATRDFPGIDPVGFDTAVLRALDRYRTIGPATTWFDAFDVRRLSPQFLGVREGMLIDRRERLAKATSHQVASIFTQLGGKGGWLYADGLWKLRGLLDRAVGGIGLRRGRRSATDLRLGDAIDFWRVDAYEPDRLLRLRAEMKLPGKAWLEFQTDPLSDGRTRLTQTAFFEPRGLFGFLYWYAVAPFHGLIFGRMASQIALLAEKVKPQG
ncbi:MAG: SDR family oxidoreductase [Candidatus Eremiobacteraeota bacterium]|nr:SDR family oxidoreductase [Candidatus Eremiobacteraeota bacterium]